MLEYHKFKIKYLENIYSINKIDDSIINKDYEKFNKGIIQSEKLAIRLLNREGFNLSDNPIEDIINDNDYDYASKYNDIMLNSLMAYLEDVYGNERIDGSGMCLKSNLIGRACQMIHNEDLLGIVKGYDENHPRMLIVDFGDESEVKVDVDEIIIAGQKKA